MQQKVGQRVQLGLFVTLAAMIFIAAVYFMGNKQNVFGRFFRLETTFRQIGGLREGSNVRYMGVSVGTVESTSILSDTSIQIVMLIQDESRKYIRKNAIASIGTDGLVGEKVIDINPGTGKDNLVDSGDVLSSKEQVSTDELLGTLNATNENAAKLVENLVNISDKIYSGEGTLGTLLRDEALAQQLQQAAVNLNQTSLESIQLMKDLQQTVVLIEEGRGMLSTLLTDSTWVVKMESSLNNIEQATMKVDQTTSELQELIHKFNNDDGTVGTLLQDTAVAGDLKEILYNINEGSERFSENMKALRSNFFFRKYFKKQAKAEQKAQQQY